jgi:polyisoprenoid-binding protein YceI
MAAGVNLKARVPEYELDDLLFAGQAEMDRSSGRITLKKARLSSDRWNLNTVLSGSLRRTDRGVRDTDISFLMTMKQGTNRVLYGDWNYKGSVRIESRLRGDAENARLQGRIHVQDLHLASKKELLEIRGLSCDIPWNILVPPPTFTVPLFTTSKDELIRGKSAKEKPNFTLASASASHPARSSLLTYVKDARANITIDKNVLRIMNLKGNVLNGTLYGRDISINLSDLSPGEIEFAMDVNLNEADISILDKPVRGKEKDARLSLNARFRGKGIDLEKELTATGYVNIYQIGERFANRLMRGLSTEKGKSKLGNLGQFAVDNTMKINRFNFTLDRGLVYTTVTLDKRFLGLFVGVKNDRIEFERIPLQEYLRKVTRGE